MMEKSLVQEREYWDQRIGEAQREVQKIAELAEEFAKLADRIHSVEPTSPTAGMAQREVLQFCTAQQRDCMIELEKKKDRVNHLKAGRP